MRDGRSGGGPKAPHLKSMGSYELHAWRDAMAIAELLDEVVGASKAHGIYQRIGSAQAQRFEREMEDSLSDFIGRSESQRPAVVRKLPDEVTTACFLTLAILGCQRSMRIMELRDSYREVLAPGKGNRVTTRGLYDFSVEVVECFEYDWPAEVFSELGIDDYDLDEQGGTSAPAEPLPEKLTPRVPPPPPAVVPATRTEVVVSIGKSETVKATANSDQGAWKLQLIEERSACVAIWLHPSPADRVDLVELLVRLAEMKWGDKKALLLLPESQQQLVDELNAAGGGEIAAVMRKGVSAMSFMKWPEEILRALRRELELIGEAMPAAIELMKAVDGEPHRLLICRHADPKEDWLEQRGDLEKWVKAILVGRGRWLGPTDATAPASPVISDARDLAKAKRKVAQLEGANRTNLGDGLLMITRAFLLWRSGEITTEAAMTQAADAYIQYRFREPGHAFSLSIELEQLFGPGSAEMDIVDGGLLHALAAPFHCKPAEARASSLPVGGWQGNPFTREVWVNAWWGVVHTDGEIGEQTWMPSASALVTAATAAQPIAGVSIRIEPRLIPLQRPREPTGRSWSDARRRPSPRGEVGQLLSWLAQGGAFHPYSGPPKADGCTRWGVLVAATSSTPEPVASARAAWNKRLAQAVEARIHATDQRGKRTSPPPGLRVLPESIDFLGPERVVSERLALMSGMQWNAERGEASAPARLR